MNDANQSLLYSLGHMLATCRLCPGPEPEMGIN